MYCDSVDPLFKGCSGQGMIKIQGKYKTIIIVR